MPHQPTTHRVMHPVDVDCEVIMAFEGLVDFFPRPAIDMYIILEAGKAVRFPNDIRRGIVNGWRYCSDLGEHIYTVEISTQGFEDSDLFTPQEKFEGLKLVTIRQKYIVGSS